MRTKILLASAAVMALGLASSNAQVYSANVVGYVQVPLVSGFNLVANPLDLDGTGTNNTVQTAFGTQLPTATLYAMSGGTFAPAAGYSAKNGWTGATNSVNPSMNPGGGVFVSVATSATVTFVGNVHQGSLSAPYGTGYNLVSSPTPISGLMQHQLNFIPPGSVTVLPYVNGTGYGAASGYSAKNGWTGAGEPTLTPGQAVLLSTVTAGSWTTNFTVQ